MARKTLSSWIREAITDPEKKKCTKIGMFHLVAGQNHEDVYSIDVYQKQVDPDEIATLFRGKAEAYAQDLPGRQGFKMLAFYEDSKEPQASHHFSVSGRTDWDGETEPPTNEGAKAQHMRHYENQMGLAFQQQRHLNEHSNSVIADQGRQIRDLMNEVKALFRISQEMMVELAKSQHDRRMEELQFARDSKEREFMMRMLPAVGNSLTGGMAFPKESEDTALIEMFAKSLTPEKAQMLMQS